MKHNENLGGFTAIAGSLLVLTGIIPVAVIGFVLTIVGAHIFGAFVEPKNAKR